MLETPLVSVILPTYNRADLLPRAIDSVLKQAYQNWELIIWDDGSTDQTREVVQLIQDNRICYFSGGNLGASYARNRAIEISQGKYLAFLDSDDEWLPRKLTYQVETMQAFSEIGVLFCDFLNIDESKNKESRIFQQYKHVFDMLQVEQKQDHLFFIHAGMPQALAVENLIALDTVMLRKSCLQGKSPFREDLENSEDFEYWWRLGLAGVSFAYINTVHLVRYKPFGSLSSPTLQHLENNLRSLDICIQQSLAKGRDDLLPYLQRSQRNSWQNLITLHAAQGNKQKMWHAFQKSLDFGFNLGSMRLLLQGLLFPDMKNEVQHG